MTPKLIITVDTEEDEWGQFDLPRYGVRNLERLPALQAVLDEAEYRPTYLVTHPVAESRAGQEILAPVASAGRAEIGAHCHPWSTPPVVEARTRPNSMLCNLVTDLQFEKLDALREAIRGNFGLAPTSFRAGRWGFSAEVARHLPGLGFKVDSSITPHISWARDFGPDFNRPYPEAYRVSLEDLRLSDPDSELVEIPVTTGFTGRFGRLGERVHRSISTGPLGRMGGRGLAARAGLFAMTWLCPEVASAEEMIEVTEALLARGRTILNLMFHSVVLTAGLTPFVRSTADESAFLDRIRHYLAYARRRSLTPATLSEAAQSFGPFRQRGASPTHHPFHAAGLG